MKLLGIEFAPLNIPFERRLQTFAVFQWVLSFLFLGFGCFFISVYLLFTRFYFIPLAYLVWYVADHKTSRHGGRRQLWIQRWKLWEYFRDYFPIHLVKTVELDPQKNYIFGVHPHGVLSISAFLNFCTEATNFRTVFPGIQAHLMVLPGHFLFPFYREYFMSAGAVSSSRDSMEWLLTRSGTGNALCCITGGALEALESCPGKYDIKLKNRKGFIKIALRYGTSLVPVFSFGETDLFLQAPNPDGSLLKTLQVKVTKYLGFSPPLFHGRGIFNYTFGVMPFRKPVHTVVGRPIDVEKVENPSQDDIDKLHKIYLEALTELFDQHKTKYGLHENMQLHIIE